MALLLAVAAGAGAAWAGEQRTTLAIKPDGSSVLTVDRTELRPVAEQQARMWEHFRKQNLGEAEDESEDAKPSEPQKEVKPLTDEELARMLRTAFETQLEQQTRDAALKIETLEVKSNTVRTVTTQSFDSLEDMLRQFYAFWGQMGWSFENVKLEKDGDGHLRLTLVPAANALRFTRNLRQQWKMSGMKSEWRLVFPGPVHSSGWSNVQDNATWLVIDAQNTESVEAALKLVESQTVFTADLGGLKLDQPLESKSLMLAARSPAAVADLPITDGGPGYLAEPVAVTTTALHYFDEGERRLKEAGFHQLGQAGTIVRAKLFPPRDRTLQSVSGVRVLKAVDDRGRAVAAPVEDHDKEANMSMNSAVYASGAGARPGNSMQINLLLQLPQPDARSIEQLSGEAIAVTVGHWKEMALTNLTTASTNEVDLGEILPGARLTILKLVHKNRQFMMQARLAGPDGIRQIELQAKTIGSPANMASANETGSSNRHGRLTRNLQLNYYTGMEEGGAAGMPSIIVRFPEDQRRERVRFTLNGLDLL